MRADEWVGIIRKRENDPLIYCKNIDFKGVDSALVNQSKFLDEIIIRTLGKH